jgi:hypothetical protein
MVNKKPQAADNSTEGREDSIAEVSLPPQAVVEQARNGSPAPNGNGAGPDPIPGAGWRGHLGALEGLPLLPLGGEKGKVPLNPATGAGSSTWLTDSFTPRQIEAAKGFVSGVGTRCGPDAGGLLAFDFDGRTAMAFALAAGCDPASVRTWRIARPSATDRIKVVFRVPEAEWERITAAFGVRGYAKHVTFDPGPGEESEQIELFWSWGQIAIAGCHRKSGDHYDWDGTSPQDVAEIPPEWEALLLQLLTTKASAPPPPAPAAAPAPAKAKTRSRIRGLDRPADIAVPLEEFISREHRDVLEQGSPAGRNHEQGTALALDLHGAENWLLSHGAEPQQGHDALTLFDAYVARSRERWPAGKTFDAEAAIARFDGARELNPAPSTPEEALLERLAFHRGGAKATAKATRFDGKDGGPICLGFDGDRYSYRTSDGQVREIVSGAHTPTNLFTLAHVGWWRERYPKGKGEVDWQLAVSDLFARQRAVGPFRAERCRGLGVWMDQGRVVWHQGSRLVVDGQVMRLQDVESEFIYVPRPAVIPAQQPEPLDDATGLRVFNILARVGWPNKAEGVRLAGLAVIGPAGGSLNHRPHAVCTADKGKGKSEGYLEPVGNLWGGPGLHIARSAPTEAHVRQILGCDALPVVVDEWERMSGRRMTGFLELLRITWGRTATGRGSAGGRGIDQQCRSVFALAGINVSHSDEAARSRSVLNHKQYLPSDEWRAIKVELDQFITPELGQRLIARTVANLNTLLHNIGVFHRAIVPRLRGPEPDRRADVHASFMAGAMLMLSTQRLEAAEEANQWLERFEWEPEGDESEAAGGESRESGQVLTHLLSFKVPWRDGDDPTGAVTLGELIHVAAYGKEPVDMPDALGVIGTTTSARARKAAVQALGRSGLKVEDGFLLVANTGPIESVFATTRWLEGGHRERLLDLEGAEVLGRTTHFSATSKVRAVRVPLGLVFPPDDA